jgi:hypothetical protein
MAATISICENNGELYNGEPSSETAKLVFYFIRQDDATISPADSPVIIPAIGTNYSFEVWLRARVDVAPDSQCYNFKAWYDSGIPGDGYKVTVNSDIVSSYVQPVNVESVQGTRIDFTTKNSEIDSLSLDGTLINIGDYTSWLVFQLEIDSDADRGSNELVWYLQYDEI